MRTTFLPLIWLGMQFVSSATEIKEDFVDLANWKPLYFPKISTHTIFEPVKFDGCSAVKMTTSASASGLTIKQMFDPRKTPILQFRWQTAQVWKKGNASEKTGDDYRKAFGKAPPSTATISIMSDADNTGESGGAWIDYLRVSPTRPEN